MKHGESNGKYQRACKRSIEWESLIRISGEHRDRKKLKSYSNKTGTNIEYETK